MNRKEITSKLNKLVSDYPWIAGTFVVMNDSAKVLLGIIPQTDQIELIIGEYQLMILDSLGFKVGDVDGIRQIGGWDDQVTIYNKLDNWSTENVKYTMINDIAVQSHNVADAQIRRGIGSLPLPFEPFDGSNSSIFHNLADYRDTLLMWSTKNMAHDQNTALRNGINVLKNAIPGVRDEEQRNELKQCYDWLEAHITDLRYLYDFSGMLIGIRIDERLDQLELHDFRYRDSSVIEKLYGIHKAIYLKMSLIEKLDWLAENCDFIPLRVDRDDVTDRRESHRWRSIKKDAYTVAMLYEYLKGLQYPPNDNVFYYVHAGDNGWFLHRDLRLSPRPEKN